MILPLLIASCLVTLSHATGCQRVVCYYTNWAQYRPGNFKFFPEHIDAKRCTHINFAFATMEGKQLKAYEWNDESTDWSTGMYQRTVDRITAENPSAKLLLSVGGWNMGTSQFTAMVANQAGIDEFVQTSIQFLRMRNFDGLDLDFEYPGSRGSPPADKHRYTNLTKTLREAFEIEAASSGNPRLLLTAAVSAGNTTTAAGYDVMNIHQYFDFINIMTYDLHGAWETFTGHNSPLYARPDETGSQALLNVDWAAQNWVNQGLPKDKLVLGLATYGRTFKLQNTNNYGMAAPASGAGPAGTYTREAGFKSYYEICGMIQSGAIVERDTHQRVPYLHQGTEWVGYEDQTSLREKVGYMMAKGYGGVMIWALDLDDFTGSCGEGVNPLLTAIVNECGGIPQSPLPAIPSPSSQNPSLPIPPARPPALPHAIPPPTRPYPQEPAASGLRPSGPHDYRRVDPSQYSARHGAQTNMFQVPTGRSGPQQASGGATAVHQVVSAVSADTFVLSTDEKQQQPSAQKDSRKLALQPSPDFETYSQRMSSANTQPPRQRAAIPMVDVSMRADAPKPFNPIQLSQIPVWKSVQISQIPVRKSPRISQSPFGNTFQISQTQVRRASQFPKPSPQMNIVKTPRTSGQRDDPSRPSGFIPRVSAARVSAPRSSAPSISPPRVSAPRASAPRASAPRASAPRASAPRVSAPRASAPRVSAPRASARRVSAPRASTPRASARRVSAPRASAPRVSAPRVTTPRASAPSNSAQRVSAPSASAPRISSKVMAANLNTFLKNQAARTGLFTSTYLSKLLRGGGGSGRGGVKINPYNDDSTDDFNCFMRADGFYPSPSNCRNFFICKSNTAYVKKCQEGLVYNPNLKLCDWETNYNCQVDFPATPSPTPGGTQATQPPKFCSGKNDGRYADPATCNNYIDCVSSHTYIMPCAAGTVFNQLSNGCDVPQNVPGCNA